MTNDISRARKALHEGALLLRAPHLKTLSITGKDRQTWLNGVVTCDLAPRRAGDAVYGFAVAKNGKLLAELFILLDDKQILVGAASERIELLAEHFDKYVIMEDVTIEAPAQEVSWVLAHGPEASRLVALARAHGAIAAGSVDMSGKGGALLALEKATVDDIVTRLQKEPVVEEVELANWDKLRVEIAIPRWGVDFNEENYPQEASLEHLGVSFQKGCYLGQEAVFMLQMRGHVKKKIVKLNIEGSEPLAITTEIHGADGATVGSLTSTTENPEASGMWALGYVKWKQSPAGTELLVAGRKAIVA
jgi:tRNA-modifying protein YgfZ